MPTPAGTAGAGARAVGRAIAVALILAGCAAPVYDTRRTGGLGEPPAAFEPPPAFVSDAGSALPSPCDPMLVSRPTGGTCTTQDEVWYWTGSTCTALPPGCGCEGPDCARALPTEASCLRGFVVCGAVAPDDAAATPTSNVQVSINAQCGDMVCPASHPYVSGCSLTSSGFSQLCVVSHSNFVHFQDGGVCDTSRPAQMSGSISCSRTPPSTPATCHVPGGSTVTSAQQCGSGSPNPGTVDPGAGGQPTTAICTSTTGWSGSASTAEAEVLRLTNEARARGANCGVYGRFGPAPALTNHDALRCAARLHSKAMSDSGNFSHTGNNGSSPGDRASAAGFPTRSVAENIFMGPRTAASAVNGWLDSDGHCRNMMNPSHRYLGVGQFGQYWTQNFGR